MRLFIKTCQALSSCALGAALSLCSSPALGGSQLHSGRSKPATPLCSFGSVENLPCNRKKVGAIEMPGRLIGRLLKTMLIRISSRNQLRAFTNRALRLRSSALLRAAV